MATSTSQPDVPPSTLPAPHPTHPVAQQTVTEEAPEFRWISIPEAGAYRLQLARSEAFEALLYDEVVEEPTTLTLSEVVPDDAETVVWRVRAEADEAPWSSPARFSVAGTLDERDDAQFLVDAPPVPIYPIHGDVVDTDAPAFTWEAVPEASGYRVQVASDEGFDDIIIDLTVDQTTSLTLFGRLPDEAVSRHWRVCALFPNDTEGPWSESVQFETDPEAAADTDFASEGDVAGTEEDESPSVERSPVAAGPARTSQTSGAMALAFIAVLLVSFLLTLLLIVAFG